ncbi:MAG: phosphoadenosine phosphosulfate reductase family protein [Fusobacterium sp.]|uniref:phosphoadenosine phosphosulfate reductase family protein n=1 Tax=Fusobacterium sp. TaxID=68766 RepID=UPI002A7484DD|nr:phosphoadenosine phosphosulfate reductase family protein [Fusobacterium sp.]MDY3059298.1 phosphoadenosine phosphosulfate reductase family protein [Fusobacterium sp.]
MKKHIVSFSGGKDSTAMLLMMIEKEIKIDEIIFLDTGAEFPDMYNHIKKVENYINRKIIILKAENNFEYMMLHYEKKKGKNKGQKGYSWPDFRNRWCTQYLKKSVISKYLKKYKNDEIIEFHGIAADEVERLNKNKEKNIRYPLAEWNISEKQALQYCYDKGFTWNGLYKNFDRVSCWCCPLKSLKELKILYKKYPELWTNLEEWDNKTYRKFRSDYSIKELSKKFEGERNELYNLQLLPFM